ncbi:Tol-Pal system protein TolQ [hydrothermal vent metagenome]|uniref:Tol-Pal system protein TolQ n=1 Tax=hydrothermal vent metagenome TaxID=652676 RepID=A0A3B0Z4F8_9ZZZZ
MTTDMSFVHLITQASVLVQLVMLLLLLASVMSWFIIFQKGRLIRGAQKEAKQFEDQFWSGKDVTQLYKQICANSKNSGMAAIFEMGYREFMRQKGGAGGNPEVELEACQRRMRVVLSRELDELESQLPFLATVASTSPYVGLFGTVWGIMNSFRAIGSTNNATIAMVAPGIAEALIATAMGLFAAIPAVIAYNRYINQVDRLNSQYENFLEEFYSLLHRKAYNP